MIFIIMMINFVSMIVIIMRMMVIIFIMMMMMMIIFMIMLSWCQWMATSVSQSYQLLTSLNHWLLMMMIIVMMMMMMTIFMMIMLRSCQWMGTSVPSPTCSSTASTTGSQTRPASGGWSTNPLSGNNNCM